MKPIWKAVLVVLFALAALFMGLRLDAARTFQTSNTSIIINNGDVLKFSSEAPVRLEAQGKDSFTFVYSGEAVTGEPFAGGYVKTLNPVPNEIKIVEHKAQVSLTSSTSFEYTYIPGPKTRSDNFMVFFLIFWVLSMVVAFLIPDPH
ncbi:MAG TPA: hypothetical protein VF837_05640 [Patescibacteria group bacterium]